MKKFIKGFFRLLLILVLIAVIGAGAGLVYLTVTEFSPENTETIDVHGTPTINVSAGDKLNVMTYNISKASCASAEELNSNIASIVKLNVDNYAHVSFFQEVDIDSGRTFSIDEASLLSNGIYGRTNAVARDYVCSFVPAGSPEPVGKIDSGELSMTRFNVDSAERVALTNGGSWPVGIWSRKPCLLVERSKIEDSNKELVMINLCFTSSDDGDIRQTQYKELCEFMQMEFAKGNYVIAGGDFSSLLPSVSKSKFDHGSGGLYEISTSNLTGGWKYCTDDSTPTYRAPDGSEYVIDGFITSPNTIVSDTRTIDTEFKYSDHNPVLTEITLVK